MRGGAGRVELDPVDESRALGAIDLLRRRRIRQVQREQRLEARVGRQRRQDSLAIGLRQRDGGYRPA